MTNDKCHIKMTLYVKETKPNLTEIEGRVLNLKFLNKL